MPRLRALSFISDRLNNRKKNDNASGSGTTVLSKFEGPNNTTATTTETTAPLPAPHQGPSPASSRASPVPGVRKTDRSVSGRPASAIFPPNQQLQSTGATPDALPELEPIIGYMNIQAQKLYCEGYLLKLNDLDTQGRPYTERQWVECFAQLVGTVLWMWEADALEESAGPADVHPATTINIADGTIRMVEALPTRFAENQPLENVLSLSTAGKNRYLLHFSSLHSLTQWTAAIRLSQFENTLLQESYTGALIAGKGKRLNNMKTIYERARFKYEDWVQVRFSPGTEWKRCWCVITPPDEKEIQKAKKAEKKKKSSYERSTVRVKGTIKLYQNNKKTKKVKPLVTITDAYSAFALYPQSQSMIEHSTLVKLEGQITMHGRVETSTEGFVFVMPQLRPPVSGVELLMRWLFPVYDAFGLYGRPLHLLSDTVSTKSLMFAMPQRNKTDYLDNLDVANLIHTEGSGNWSEAEWRKRLKDATSRRMAAKSNSSRNSSTRTSRVGQQRSSFPRTTGPSVRFGDSNNNNGVASRLPNNHSTDAVFLSGKGSSSNDAGAGAGPPGQRPTEQPQGSSYANGYGRRTPPSNNSLERVLPEEAEEDSPPPPRPPPHGPPSYNGAVENAVAPSPRSSDSSEGQYPPPNSMTNTTVDQLHPSPQPSPVALPPAFIHGPGDTPPNRPRPSQDLKRANSRVSYGTLSQMAEMSRSGGDMPPVGAAAAWNETNQAQPPDYSESKPDPSARRSRDLSAGGDGATDSYDGNLAPGNQNVVDGALSPVSPITPLNNASGSPSRNSQPPCQSPVSPPKAVTTRKPAPQQAPEPQSRSRTNTADSSSLGSLRHAIDMDALNHVVTRDRSTSPEKRESPIKDEESSVYDQASVSSPDYASSHKSSVSKKSASSGQKQRMGVKKSVGTPDPGMSEVKIGDSYFQRPAENADGPKDSDFSVDFGPTHTYNPLTRRPSTSETLTMFGHERNKSDATLGPTDKKNVSPGPGRGTPDRYRRTESPAQDERRRSVLWQPGMVSEGRTSPGPARGLTPEQFVYQRAEGERNASPTYAHRRGPSQASASSRPRPVSGDWTTFTRSPAPRDITPRPHSRGASTVLNQSELSPHLSAREQEHVARVTGSSFFNLSNNNNEASKQQDQQYGPGLVSAIDARERERQAMKEGVSGHMVQQAIAQRQQQGSPHQYQSPQHYQYQYQQAQSPPPSYAQPYQYRHPAPGPTPQQYGGMPQPYGHAHAHPYSQQQQQQPQPQWDQQSQMMPQQPPMYSQPPPPPMHQDYSQYR